MDEPKEHGLRFKHWHDVENKPPEVLEIPNLKEEFLANLETSCNVTESAAAIAIEKAAVWKWRRTDKKFASAWDTIMRTMALPIMEAEAIRRACTRSDTLLMFMLKAADRDRYDDKVAVMKSLAKNTGIRLTLKDVNGDDLASAREHLTAAAMAAGVVRQEDFDEDSVEEE